MSEDALSFIYRDGYMNSLVLESLTHGIYTSIFVSAFSVILTNSRRRRQVGLIFGLVAMYLFASMHLAVRWYWVRQAFIVNGENKETVFLSFMDERYRWMWGISGVSASLGIITADCVLIWRCWIIWCRNWVVVALPIVSVLLGTVFDGLFLWQDIGHSSATDGLNFGIQAVNWGMAYFATSLATTIMCTSLIVFRISTIGQGAGYLVTFRSYRGIIEVVTESAAIYAISLVIYMAFLAQDDPRNCYPQAVLISCSGIAPTLIVARVASGQARPDDSWSTRSSSLSSGSLTFARFGHGSRQVHTDIPLNITMHHDFLTDSIDQASRRDSKVDTQSGKETLKENV